MLSAFPSLAANAPCIFFKFFFLPDPIKITISERNLVNQSEVLFFLVFKFLRDQRMNL